MSNLLAKTLLTTHFSAFAFHINVVKDIALSATTPGLLFQACQMFTVLFLDIRPTQFFLPRCLIKGSLTLFLQSSSNLTNVLQGLF